jgi:hypothetical protein
LNRTITDATEAGKVVLGPMCWYGSNTSNAGIYHTQLVDSRLGLNVSTNFKILMEIASQSTNEATALTDRNAAAQVNQSFRSCSDPH